MTVRDRTLRDHQPVTLNKFNGLWQRGDPYSTPLDHFENCENIKFVGTNAFGTRDGVGISQTVAAPLEDILRIYNYATQTANTYLVLIENGANGEIYHVVDSETVFGPILTIAGMTDFGFIPYAGRAYITPFATFELDDANPKDLKLQKGIEDEFLYVYLGAGVAARKAAGDPPTGTVSVANGAAGLTDAGFHLFGVVFETDTGYLSPPAAFAGFTTGAALSVTFTNVPVSAETHITKRHIVATRVIPDYNDDTTGYQYFFIPDATIDDNTTTTLADQSFFDADLLSDASHLLDNFSEIAAGVGLTLYHNRLCLYAEFDNISLVRVSALGEPEAISQIDGLLIVPPDGNPITNAQEMRDVLYVTKRSRTTSFVDNGDVPSSWALSPIDNALGCPPHGISTVLDSGATSVDFLIVATYRGLMIFNGTYIIPELSWKIQNLWFKQDRNEFIRIQIVNDPTNQQLYCVLPDRRLLLGNYANGFDPKNIRWVPWRFDFPVNSVALVNIDELVIGGDV